MKYQGPFRDDLPAVDTSQSNNPDASAAYVNGNPALGIEGSIPPAAAFEAHQRELVHLIEHSGQTPIHSDLEQVRKAIKWMIEAGVITNAGGTPVYEGKDAGGLHKIRPLIAGTNITIDLVENPVSSGRYGIRINSSAGGGGGGGGSPHVNVGTGAQIHKGNNGTADELRSILVTGGLSIGQNANDITITFAPQPAWSLMLRNAGSSGLPTGVGVFDLTLDAAPQSNDRVILGKSPSGDLRSTTVAALRGAGAAIPAAGVMTISTGLSAHVVSSSNVGGGSVALTPGNNLSVRLTFAAALANTNYLVQISQVGGSPVTITRTKATTHVDLAMSSEGSTSASFEIMIVTYN
jgi:hypothetical protein